MTKIPYEKTCLNAPKPFLEMMVLLLLYEVAPKDGKADLPEDRIDEEYSAEITYPCLRY